MGEWRITPQILFLLLIASFASSLPISQIISCSFDANPTSMLCKCSNDYIDEDTSTLKIDKENLGDEVTHVTLDSCPSLTLSIDLLEVKATNLTIQIKNSGIVEISNIKYDASLHRHQKLNFQLQNLEKFHMEGLQIDDTLMVSSSLFFFDIYLLFPDILIQRR